MKPKKNKASEASKAIPKPADIPDEPYRYPLDLVATIAVRFVDSNTGDKAATDRAIAFLDTVEKTIAGRMMMIRARKADERIAAVTPKRSTFAKGIKWITSKDRGKEAEKAFFAYLLLNSRLSVLGRPSQLTDQQVKELLATLPTKGESQEIERLRANFQSKGFNQVQLATAKQDYDRLQEGLVRPYWNSIKGKKGAAVRKAKNILDAKTKKKK